MFDEEGNGDVKTQELERLMSLMGINPTKRELSQMAKDVDKDGEYKLAVAVNIQHYGSKNTNSLNGYFKIGLLTF